MKNRRKFIQLSTAFGVGAFLPLQFCTAPKQEEGDQIASASENNQVTLSAFGLQLYSVKENMAEDPVGTIRKIADYGYKQIEGFDGGKGIFWGMKNTEFKSLTDGLGLDFIASHANTFDNLNQQAADAGAIGMEYLICPWVGPQKSMDDFKRLADEFNRMGQVCKDNGIRFAYHNHGYTFTDLEGQVPQNYLMENTDPDLVDFEMDIYWVKTAGFDPEEYLKKYPNRFTLGHIKDKDKSLDPAEANGSTLIGTGSLDFQSIIRTAKDNGMEYFIVEQERFEGTTPMEAAEKNAAYLKNFNY
jgi:sugar phosphate isomerase/epimerase